MGCRGASAASAPAVGLGAPRAWRPARCPLTYRHQRVHGADLQVLHHLAEGDGADLARGVVVHAVPAVQAVHATSGTQHDVPRGRVPGLRCRARQHGRPRRGREWGPTAAAGQLHVGERQQRCRRPAASGASNCHPPLKIKVQVQGKQVAAGIHGLLDCTREEGRDKVAQADEAGAGTADAGWHCWHCWHAGSTSMPAAWPAGSMCRVRTCEHVAHAVGLVQRSKQPQHML